MPCDDSPTWTGGLARLLVQLGEPVPMGQLAERLGCDPSNVTSLVDRLDGAACSSAGPTELTAG